MSIAGIYAEYSNEKRNEWVNLLEEAYNNYDWDMIQETIKTMKTFYFSE